MRQAIAICRQAEMTTAKAVRNSRRTALADFSGSLCGSQRAIEILPNTPVPLIFQRVFENRTPNRTRIELMRRIENERTVSYRSATCLREAALVACRRFCQWI